MLFSRFLPSVDDPDPVRLALIDAILLDFRKAFPELTFELRLDRNVINAQAILLNGKRCVLIYGGLALHQRLAESSLVFVVLHEVGHHLAIGPRLPFNVSLACDCVADSWAAGEGALILHRKSDRRLQIHEAVDELDHFMNSEHQEFCTAEMDMPKCRYDRWALRKNGLEVLQPHASIRTCQFLKPK
jgi:hypothetical protein